MPEGRKLVTILFADVTGSTALGEVLDPEDVRALMDRYYQHAHQIIPAHGGTLEKFIGDAVMAVFGLPTAHGDDAERALAAALALRGAIADDAVLAGRLVLRMGVNTGEVVAAADASRGEFLVTGDAVNVAARLEQAAEPGEILAGARTHAAAEAAMRFGEPREIAVKGKRDPLRVYPLDGPREARQRSRPPLVGRRRELAQLNLLRDAALEERHPQLVSIVAPAGTGKTRLLEEFLGGLDADEGWRVAAARCLPYGQSLTYWPLRGLLDDLLGAPFTLDLVRAAYVAGGQTGDDAARLAGYVLTSLGVERVGQTDQPVERESTFAAWRLLVEALARHAPRIVIFEDLHWASESLLDLVEHVTHPRTQAALMIVVLSRTELLDRRPAWGGGMRNFTVLALDALGGAQTRQLVDQLVPESVAEPVRAQIVERSGGNPFFAIELARGLAERLGSGNGRDAATVNEAGDLPETVHEAVLARLDQLSAPEREVLQVAAVAGRTFRPPTLRAALPAREPEAITSALEGLLARDVVAPVEGETGTYTFRHILFRDVAYGSLARAERVRLHLAVARWLEAFAEGRVDEFVELLAYHYREAATLAAQSAVPLNIEIDMGQAVRYLVRAGEVASHAGLSSAAIAHLRAAIALAPVAEHERLYERLGDVAVMGDEAIEGYQHAVDLWRARGEVDPLSGARLLRKQLRVYWAWWTSYRVKQDMDALEAWHAEALRLAELAGDEDESWRVRLAPLNAFVRPNDREQRERERAVCQAAVTHFESRQDWPALYEALDGYSGYSQVLGDYQAAIAAARYSLEWPDLPAWARDNAHGMIAKSHLFPGEWDASLAAVREALAQVRPGDSRRMLNEVVDFAPMAAYLGGRWDELELFRRVLEESWDEIASEYDGNRWWGYLPLLLAALAREDRPDAEAIAGKMHTLQAAAPNPFTTRNSLVAVFMADDVARFDVEALSQSGLTAVWTLGYFAKSQSGLTAVWTLGYFAERGLHAPVALINTSRESDFQFGHRYADVAEALNADDNIRLAAAIAMAEARHLAPFAARMRIVLAQRTGDRAPLDLARPVLEWLGDRQFLRRLEEVEAALGVRPASQPAQTRKRVAKRRAPASRSAGD